MNLPLKKTAISVLSAGALGTVLTGCSFDKVFDFSIKADVPIHSIVDTIKSHIKPDATQQGGTSDPTPDDPDGDSGSTAGGDNNNPNTDTGDTPHDNNGGSGTNPDTGTGDTSGGGTDDWLEKEQTNVTDTETGNIQNLDVRMARMVQEYKLTLNLVNTITAETADSGAWNDPKTWKGGRVPTDGARILIHKEHRVTINREIRIHYRTIKVEGELAFNPHRDTALYVDTILTMPGSVLRIGEPQHPIDPDRTARIIISDYNEEGMITGDTKSSDYDPLRIGQGILTNGLFLAHGAYKTPYLMVKNRGIEAGKKRIFTYEAPEGWHVGDKVALLGTAPSGTETEVRTIASIDGKVITVDEPFAFDHLIPETAIKDDRLHVHIANLTRNIIIESDPQVLKGKGDKNDPKNVEHRGHVLFMHNNNVNIHSVAFVELGRTNKKFPLDETIFTSEDADAKATKIGTNQAARYPVHFHRAGLDGKVGRIFDCVIDQSPGWGYVNHSSNVIMKENVAYGVYGASFITEAGDENGIFEGNMAIATRGYGRSTVKGWGSRTKYFGDGGFQGNGFWIIGPNVKIVDNIVNGSSNSAFAMRRSTIDDVTGIVDSDSQQEQPYANVGLKNFSGNIAYGNSGGVFGILGGTRQHAIEKLVGLLAWNNAAMSNSEMISWWYPDDVSIDGLKMIGDIHNPRYIGIGTQSKLRRTTLKNIKIEGLEVGLRIPEYVGPNVVENAYLNNRVNMLYYAGTTNKGANTRIQGNIEYGDLPGDTQQTRIKFALKVRDVSFKNYLDRQFNTYNIVYAPEGETPMKLYMTKEQSPDYRIEVGRKDVEGKTNAELIKMGHKPVGGELVPDNAKPLEGMENVSGAPVE